MMRWATLMVLAMALGACADGDEFVGDGSGFGADTDVDSSAQVDATTDVGPGLEFGYGDDGRCFGVYVPSLTLCEEGGCARCECDSGGRPVRWEHGSFCEEQRNEVYEEAEITYNKNLVAAVVVREWQAGSPLVGVTSCSFDPPVPLNVGAEWPECESWDESTP